MRWPQWGAQDRGAEPRGPPAAVGQDRLDGPSCFPDAAPRRRWWLNEAAVGDPERCVYGGHLLAAVLPFSPGSSSCHPPQQHGRGEEASVAEPEQNLGFLLHKIERSIVVPACRNASAREYFPDYTRRLGNYLAAGKNLRMLLLQHPDVLSGRLHGRATSLLDTVMASLAMEFCRLNIWRPHSLRGHLECSSASIWEAVRFSRDGGSASASDSSGTSLTGGGSGGTEDEGFDPCDTALGEERTVQSGKEFSRMTCIDPKSLSILDDIAGVMIEAGYEHMLRDTFHRHFAQLARRIEILDMDNVLGSHTEESREMLRKVWTWAMQVNIGVLAEMQRQMTVADFGSFNTLKEEYFCSIAKLSVMKLLSSGSSICIQVGPPNDPSCKDSLAAVKQDLATMVSLVMMYQALNYAMPEILALFLGQTMELIYAEVKGLKDELSAMFVKLAVKLNDMLRSQRLVITDTGVHRLTRRIMDHLGLLAQQKNTVYLMVNDNPDEFGALVTQLVSSLLMMLDMSSRSLGLQGQQQLFLLNNVHLVLEQANKHMDLELILGES